MFFLVWQGLGAYALAVPFLMVVAVYLAVSVIFGAETAARFGTAGSGIALLASAAILWKFAKRLAARPVRTLVDKETGEEVVLREQHTMFWIPLRYWAIFYAGLGVIVLVGGLAQAIGLIPR
jgi:hypothetical protein